MIVMAAGKTLIISSDSRRQVVGCQKLVTRTAAQQTSARPKRQQLFLTVTGPLGK